MDMTSGLDFQRRNLEDAFFAEQDRKLIEKLREMRKLEETRQNLARVSGISDPALLDRLVALNIRAETVASLAIIPLVEVAWADGEIDAREKAAIFQAIDSTFAGQGGIDHTLVDEWLKQRPPPELLKAWTDYIRGLSRMLSASERAMLERDLMGHAVAVAQAAGSFLGLTSGISREEQAMLDQLRGAFRE